MNTASKLITIEEIAGASLAKPDKASVALREAPAPPPAPRKVVADDYVGDVADRTGFGGLEAVDEITMVSVPDLMSSYQRGLMTLEGVKTVQAAMIAHCELMGDRMAILDPPPDLTPDRVKNFKQVEAGYDSKYATLYYPWIKVYDPSTSDNVFVPRRATWPVSGRARTRPAACTRPRRTRPCAAPWRCRPSSPRQSRNC